MKTKQIATVALIVMGLGFGVPMFAGSGNKTYDETKVVILKDATVTNFLWANPHCIVVLDAKDASGIVAHWFVETASPASLSQVGWTRTAIEPGDKITVYLFQLSNGAPRGRLVKIVLPDGSALKGNLDFAQQYNMDADSPAAACLISSQPVCYDAIPPKDWGIAVNGLQISLSLNFSPWPSPDVPAVTLWLRNVGTSEVSVDLGGHCGLIDAQASELRAMAQSTENVSLILTNTEETKHLIYFAPWDGFCAGAVGLFHLEMEPDKTVSVPIDLRYYGLWPPTEKDPLYKGRQVTGTYSLKAEISVPDAQRRGPITSNQLVFKTYCNARTRGPSLSCRYAADRLPLHQ